MFSHGDGDLLLQAERDALALAVDAQHLDLDLVVELRASRDGWLMRPQRHVGDVEQAVDAAEVDERAEVGDVLDHALADLTFLDAR